MSPTLTDAEKKTLSELQQYLISRDASEWWDELKPIIDRLTTQPQAEAGGRKPDEHGETSESYMEIGQTFMEEYRGVLNHPAMKDFICADSPSEIIQHLLNAIDESALRTPAVDAEKLADIRHKLAEIIYSKIPNEHDGVPVPWDYVHYQADSIEHEFCYEIANALLAADIFAVPSSHPTWRTIDSAPKDGTDFLAIWVWESPTLGPCGTGTHAVISWEWMYDAWMGADLQPIKAPPSHWMPLPSPPTSTGAVK